MDIDGMFGEDMVCTGCGKDPYKSSTGCLCGPDDEHEWVRGSGTYGPAVVQVRDEDMDVVCSCGENRQRASKAPNRVLPCDKCGDEARDANDGALKLVAPKRRKKKVQVLQRRVPAAASVPAPASASAPAPAPAPPQAEPTLEDN